MDFGDFITFLFFLFFILSPFLQRRKKKKTGKSVKSKENKFSVLGKLNEILKEAAREMEAQAEQARRKTTPGQRKHRQAGENRPVDQAGETSVNQTFWDDIDDRDDEGFQTDDADALDLAPITPVNENTHFVSAKKAPVIPEIKDTPPLPLQSFGHDAIPATGPRPVSGQQRARVRGLQKAVIWSEILGKPVALRD